MQTLYRFPPYIKGLCGAYIFVLTTLNCQAETTLPTVDVGSDYETHPQDTSTATLDTGASEIYLNKEELQNTAGSQGDPLKAITTLPGVINATSNTGLSDGFYIRGSDTQDNALWIDGMPVGYIFHLGGFYSILNPDLISGFDTYLGGFGVALGDHLGGAIDVRTKTPRMDKTEQSVQVGFYDSSYRVEGPLTQNSSGYFAIRRSYLDFIMPATGELGSSRINYTQFPQFWDMQAKVHHEVSDGYVDFNLFSAQDNAILNIEEEGDILLDPALEGQMGGEEGFNTMGIKWHKRLNNQVEQDFRIGLLQTHSERFIGNQLPTDPQPGEPFNRNITGDNWFFLPQWRYQPNHGEWLVGIDSYQYRYLIDGYYFQTCQEGQPDCNLTRLPKGDIDEQIDGSELSPYIEYQYPLYKDLNVTLGLRHTNMQLEGRQHHSLSPRIAMEYQWSQKVILTANWGKYVQGPQITQLTETLGNPNLGLSEAEHRIIGTKIELSPAWSTQIELYQKPMLSLVVPEDAPLFYSTAGSGEATGLDIMLKRKWQDGRFGWISYSYANAERQDGSERNSRLFDGDQPHTLSLVWNQPMSGNWKPWHWGIKLQAHTGQPYTPVVSREGIAVPGTSQTDETCNNNGNLHNCYWNPVYGETNSERLPVYFKVDLAMERDWQYRDLKLTTRFELINVNALFRQNVIGYFYNSDYSQMDEFYDLPFMPSFSLRATF